MIRAYKFRKLELDAHTKIPSQTIEKSSNPFSYFEATKDNYPNATAWLDTSLEKTLTASYLVIKNDTIVYEKYFGGANKETLFTSYSAIKSFVGTLTGIAYKEGKIKSLDDPMTNYLPEFLKKDKRFGNITIQHLLDMRSGIDWNEGNYDAKDDAIKMGFRPNIYKYVKKIKIAQPSPENFNYKSINTLLLGLIIMRSTGEPLNKYFHEKIWQPMGMQSNATLNTDKRDFPIIYAGLNATTRDFAKFGTAYLHQGFINGGQAIAQDWVNRTVSKDTMSVYGYKNQVWSSLKGQYAFFAEGILGQFIYCVPEKNLVIVRTGRFWSHRKYSPHRFLAQTATLY